MRRIIFPAAVALALATGWLARDIKISEGTITIFGVVITWETETTAQPSVATATPVPPAPSPEVASECPPVRLIDNSAYQSFADYRVRRLVTSMGLECVAITITLTTKPWEYFEGKNQDLGVMKPAVDGSYAISIYLPPKNRPFVDDYEYEVCGTTINALEYIGDMTLAHELRHVWQYENWGYGSEEDAKEYECDFYRRDTYQYITWAGGSVSLPPTPPPISPLPPWRVRMNDLIDRWNAWNNRLRQYVGSDNVILPGYWDVFCGQMWMYEELQAIRRITPSNYISWIDAWLAIDRYHEYMCKGNFPENQEEARQMWGEWSRLVNEAKRLAP